LPDLADLLSQVFAGAAVVDDEVSEASFFVFRHLGGHAALEFEAGFGGRNSEARGKARNLLLQSAGDDDELVVTLEASGFDEQSSLADGHGLGIDGRDFVHPVIFKFDYGGMDDGIEFGDAGGECGCGKFGARDASVEVENCSAEGGDDGLIEGLAGSH